MWLLCWLMGVAVIGGYVAAVWRRCGVMESLSESWYVIAHPKWFSVSVCLGAALEWLALCGGGGGGWVCALGGVMCLGLFGVGLVPQFRTVDRRAHVWLAVLSAIGCVGMGWLLEPWLLLVPVVTMCLGVADDVKDWTWWGECSLLLHGAVCVGICLLKGGGLC